MRDNKLLFLPNTGVQHIQLEGLYEKGLFNKGEVEKYKINWDVEASEIVDGGQNGIERSSNGPTAASQPGDSKAAGSVVIGRAAKGLSYAEYSSGWLHLPFNQPHASGRVLRRKRVTAGTGSANDEASTPEIVYDMILAFDTTVTEEGTGGTLDPDHVGNDLSIHGAGLSHFWNSELVLAYLHSLCAKIEENTGKSVPMLQVKADLVALYSFLARLQDEKRIPVIQLAHARHEPVDVSLVIDFGNSRTCCVLMEPGDDKEYKYKRLQVRDPKNPWAFHDGPADSRLAFVQPSSGIILGSGPGDDAGQEETLVFGDLSIVRYGKPASDLLGSSKMETKSRGMSSPKRYMWDGDRRKSSWKLATGEDERDTVFGALLGRVDMRSPFTDSSDTDASRPTDPVYPRKAGLLFALVEVLEQAYRQINSAQYRGAHRQRPLYDRRRVIRDVVIMHPAGMHSLEVMEFEKAVERACELWAEYRTDPVKFQTGYPADQDLKTVSLEPMADTSNPPVPQPRMTRICDEGLAIQICYLNSLLRDHFPHGAETLVRALGTVRRPAPDGAGTSNGGARGSLPTLRVASLDIGGGTTDLAIADYTAHPESLQAKLSMELKFHDGFSKGGDDVACEFLRELVFPKIQADMNLSPSKWDKAFGRSGEDEDSMPPDWEDTRCSLASMVWMPIVHHFLGALEDGTPEYTSTIDPLVPDHGLLGKLDAVLETFRLPALRGGKSGKSVQHLADVEITVTSEDMSRIVNRVLEKCLEQYSDIVSQFRCDVLVLGGRPSALPAVRDLIHRQMPVPPGSVVFLHQASFGEWFPFEQSASKDSKACGVVGAAQAFLQTQDLDRIILKRIPTVGVPNILGNHKLGVEQIGEVLFAGDSQESVEFEYGGDAIVIGAKRIDNKNALSRPIYRLSIKESIMANRRTGPRHYAAFDLKVKLRRVEVAASGADNAQTDVIDPKVSSVEGKVEFWKDQEDQVWEDDAAVRAFTVKLQTLSESDYWLDSGCFKALSVERS